MGRLAAYFSQSGTIARELRRGPECGGDHIGGRVLGLDKVCSTRMRYSRIHPRPVHPLSAADSAFLAARSGGVILAAEDDGSGGGCTASNAPADCAATSAGGE